MKPCTACGLPKPLDQFYRDPRAKDGLQSRCRQCHMGPKVARINPCHCGRMKLRTRAECRRCAEAGVTDTPPRPTCQRMRCVLPALEGSRMCAFHLPRFDKDERTDEYANARTELVWP